MNFSMKNIPRLNLIDSSTKQNIRMQKITSTQNHAESEIIYEH